MKKRTILSILITLITLVLTNKHWLIIKPFEISFSIRGGTQCGIEVQLNKKNDEQFKKYKKKFKKINLKETSEANFKIKRIKKPKKLRIIISDIDKKDKLIINNIKLKNKKHKLEDFENFKITGAKAQIINNSLILIPNDEKIILLYQKELKLRSSIKFDFDIFVIILILTYLISYRLSSYIAIYKNVENKSGIEIGFLIIFFTLLFIPISNINQEDFSKQENRSLAKWEPFIKDGEINFEFGKNFDKWFNDRFNQRKNIIFIYNNLLNKLNKNYYKLNKIYFNKTTNWAYQYSWFMLNPVKNSEFNIYKNNIKKLYDFCNKNNIKLYILIPPGSGQIYPEEVKPFIVNNEKYKIEDFQNEINDYLKNDIVIYPFKELKEASKKDYIFPKSDPHLSEYGAFIGFECLMKRIKKDFPNLILPKTTDYNIKKHNQIITDFPHIYRLGYFYESLNIKELKESYITYQHKKEKELKTLKKENNTYLEDVFFPQGNNLKVYMVGSSFSENLFLFARYSFKNVYKRRYNAPSGGMELKMARWEEDILKIKPNILIITIQTNAINQFKELYKNEKESEK